MFGALTARGRAQSAVTKRWRATSSGQADGTTNGPVP
ncbi:hypothetical protein M768_15005 [Cellulosimicrobium cellulans F16]|uniref:Uncharacterized protein n=1 Tax=Cellulosimicrobium cellulans F16 TaxID=1350482 RepID=A0A0M0F4E7_CELCE|nr:hypothetical protein M768_15005 [Cellulosimicrobium cellulans F16]